MMCSSCDAEANSCDWCVSYASLRGARLQPTTASSAAGGPAASCPGDEVHSNGPGTAGLASPDHQAILQFLAEFKSAEIPDRQRVVPVPPPPCPIAPEPRFATSRASVTRAPVRFGQPWEVPGTTSHIKLPHRHQPPAPVADGGHVRTSSAPSPGSSNEILPQRRDHRGARRGAAIAAAVMTVTGVVAGVVLLPDHRTPGGANDEPPGHSVVVRQAHPSASDALPTVPARFVIRAAKP
jgi:hypothetical protein